MSYSHDKFLKPLTTSSKSINILDDTNDIKYTIDPFIITNTTSISNILRISLKSLKVVLISFSTNNETKIALIRLKEQIDILTRKIPNSIDKSVQNYVQSHVQSQVDTVQSQVDTVKFLQSQIEMYIKEYKPIEMVNRENPIGLIDGVNTKFSLNSTPDLNSEHVFLNGILMEPGTDSDYTIDNNIITFNYPLIVGFKLVCSYTTTKSSSTFQMYMDKKAIS